MEGKELYSNEDEELNPKKKSNEEEEELSNFGLPEIDGNEEGKSEEIEDPFPNTWEEDTNTEEETYAYSDSTEEDYSATEETEESTFGNYETTIDEDNESGSYTSSYYEEESGQRKSPVVWIIVGLVILALIIFGVFYFINREPDPEPMSTQPVIEQPVEDPEPVIEEPEPEPEPVREAGVYELNEPTGRYHVIVASSIDVDLVRDYGFRLARQGMSCYILAPRGNRKFHRLSVADYVSLNDAAVRSEQLKSEFGDEVWVIRY